MIGNKMDLAEQREVSFEEATKFAEENNLVYVETSAKTGKNVEDAFLSTATKISEKIKNGEIDPNSVESGIQVSGSENSVTSTPPQGGCACILI
jgi:GTPase SAR1 family protein